MQKLNLHGKVHLLPNLITSANLVMGFYAITLMLKEEPNYALAGLVIFLAMIFDVFDGMVARLTKTTSHFGMELDSLADMVSFGLAPAIMVYNKSLSMFDSSEFTHIGRIGFFICVVYTGCAALRLARFNSQIEDETVSFSGIPTPVAAGVIISYFMVADKNLLPANITSFVTQWILPIITFLLGILMVSNIRFPAPAKRILWTKHPFVYLALTAGLIVLIFTNTGLTLFILFVGYILFGLVKSLKEKKKELNVIEENLIKKTEPTQE